MTSFGRCRVGSFLLAGAFSVGCGGSEPGGTTQPTTTGSLRVSVATTGEDPDPDGYQVRVGSSVQSIGVNASVVFADLAAGAHGVTLEGLSSNCSTSNNPRSVSVTAGAEASTSFAVECEALRTSEMAAQEASDSLGSALFRIINDLDDVSSLDGFTFEPARALYQEALALDPDNQKAAFGLAITTVFALEDDPDLRAAADAWEAWLDAHDPDELNGVGALGTPGPILWRRARLPLDPTGATLGGLVTDGRVIRALIVAEAGSAQQEFPPTPAEHQALLRTIVEPALEAALEALYQVDDPAFTFEVTPAMQGENPDEADPLELDRTEVLVLQAGLEAALAGLDVATGYRTEPSPWGADGFAQAMEPGSTFATLADDGAVRLADAHERLGTAVDLLRDALDVLVAESDNQDDDVIKYDPAASGGYDDLDDYVGNEDVADARELLDEVEGALAGPTVVTVDLGQGEVAVEVDLTEFLLDPIPDLKVLLPAYDASGGRFRWTAATFGEWTFPDPTFDGVLPGMGSTAELKATIELDDLYEEFAPDGGSAAIVATDGHSCAVVVGGTAYCWGSNTWGELGAAVTTGSPEPAPVLGGLAFISISPGVRMTCGVTSSHEAYCWGRDEAGRLGIGTGPAPDECTPPPFFTPQPCARSPLPVSGGHSFQIVSAGHRHACGIDLEGGGWCWGLDEFGQLGAGPDGAPEVCDGSVPCAPQPVAVAGDVVFQSISVGEEHTCAVTTSGQGYCWGRNGGGTLGDGTGVPSSSPVPVSGGLTFASISSGFNHTCGLATSGLAYCWGVNQEGQLGNPASAQSGVPQPVSGGLVFASLDTRCGVTTAGEAYCWGPNRFGQLGVGSFDGPETCAYACSRVPVAVVGGLMFEAVSSGRTAQVRTCGVATGGDIYCWGSNAAGGVGDGSTEDAPAPVRVLGAV